MNRIVKSVCAVGLVMCLSFSEGSVATKVKLIASIDSLIHGLQLERGISAQAIGNKNKPPLLVDQRDFVDAAYEKIQAIAEEEGIELSAKTVVLIGQVFANRDKVDDFSITAKESNAKFSETNAELIRVIKEDVIATIEDKNLKNNAGAHLNLVIGKEATGKERATVLALLGLNTAIDADSMAVWDKLVATQVQNLDVDFSKMANKDLVSMYNDVKQSATYKEVIKMRVAIKAKASAGNFDVPMQTWFLKITDVINQLKKVDDKSVEYLTSLTK